MISQRFANQTEPVATLTDTQWRALQQFRDSIQRGEYSFEGAECLCGAREGHLVARRDRFGLPVDTLLCRTCGVMWTSPRMTAESLVRFYECDYRPLYVGAARAPEAFFEEQRERGERVLRFVQSVVPLQGGTVFDVGCGAGGVLLPFAEAGWVAYGCDTGSEYLARGREAGLTLVHGDEQSLASFQPADLILLNHVLEHLPHPYETLANLRSMLTDNGYLYVELPGIFRLHRTYQDFLLFLQNAHLYHFTLRTLTNVMAQAGFRLVKGNERVAALYQKTDRPEVPDTKGQYRKILLYLHTVEVARAAGVLRLYEGARGRIHRLLQKRWHRS